MKDEIVLVDRNLVPSKEAAEASGYSQDYVGQLARAGQIEASRINGLWYVDLNSLIKHKELAAEYVPEPPRAKKSSSGDTFVMFDGLEYVSSKRGAHITGYAQDYVAQLARAEKIASRQIGNRWFVEKESLVKHKQHNDELLASVQRDSVGLSRRTSDIRDSENKDVSADLIYKSDGADLMPNLKDKKGGVEYEIPIRTENVSIMNTNVVAQQARRRRIHSLKTPQGASVVNQRNVAIKTRESNGKSKISRPLSFVAVALGLFVLTSGLFYASRSQIIFRLSEGQVARPVSTQDASEIGNFLQIIQTSTVHFLKENFSTKEQYTR